MVSVGFIKNNCDIIDVSDWVDVGGSKSKKFYLVHNIRNDLYEVYSISSDDKSNYILEDAEDTLKMGKGAFEDNIVIAKNTGMMNKRKKKIVKPNTKRSKNKQKK